MTQVDWFLEMWAQEEYGVNYLLAINKSKGAKIEFERLRSILVDYEKKLQAEREKVALLRGLIESYCCCSSMGSTEGQCCFCDDLEKLKELEGKE